MEFRFSEDQQSIRLAVRELCNKFDDQYWQDKDRQHAYPEEFVQELTRAGWLAALIPEEYGGAGLNITEASIILEEINYSGGNSAACHAQMYIMGTLLRHGSPEQKQTYLPQIRNLPRKANKRVLHCT
jgi:acyl-CoA dehydrogenase